MICVDLHTHMTEGMLYFLRRKGKNAARRGGGHAFIRFYVQEEKEENA